MNIKRGLRSGDPEPEWKYYNMLNEIVGGKPTANPVEQLDSNASGSQSGTLQEILSCDDEVEISILN